MDLVEKIKAILDKDCLDSINGKCDKALMYHGPVDGPIESVTLCWLCHEHDALAREICDGVETAYHMRLFLRNTLSIPRKV